MPRIEDLALVGDLQAAAIIDREGSVQWLCLPHFDSTACFAGLLSDSSAGQWRLRPTDGQAESERRYIRETLVLQTIWTTATGKVQVTDFMPPRDNAPNLVRVVKGLSGTVEFRTELAVRFDYGQIKPWIQNIGGRWVAVAGPDSIWLDTTLEVNAEAPEDYRATWEVAAGEEESFVLTWAPSHEDAPAPINVDEAHRGTVAFWQQWIADCDYDGPYRREVRESVIVLKALTFEPTGGIVAAATTSLPERIGGVRNWDYRYCWLRDAAFTLQAFAGVGLLDEATAWRKWLLRAAAGQPVDLQIMYGLDGRRRLPEYELSWLKGFECSLPVRVGNAAAEQFQLDVYGEVLDGLYSAREAGLGFETTAWELQVNILRHLATVWAQPDSGLWEIRGPRRHFVHSKVMAWVAFDRMIRTAQAKGIEAPIDDWANQRQRIHEEVCRDGWDERRQTFTQFFGSQGLDASLLLMARVGFLASDDPRFRSTVRAVQRELTENGFILRYLPEADPSIGYETVDGLPGNEGAFLACSFWLVDALTRLGEREEAVRLLERLLALRNDLGLISEMWDPIASRQLGNTPQAFSHVEIVNCALLLSGPGRTGQR